jgi:uncharacterized OB-fold protein
MSLVLPTVDDINRPFWDGCREGVLRLQRCSSCGHLRYPISTICPKCLATEVEWEQVTGDGEIFTFVVFRHVYNEAWRDRVPYVVALVRLVEGPTLIGNVAGIDPEAVSVGMPVRVVFERVDDEITLPGFAPRGVSG